MGLPGRRTVFLYPGKGLPVNKVRLLSALAAQDVALPVFSSFLLFLPPVAVIIVGTFSSRESAHHTSGDQMNS